MRLINRIIPGEYRYPTITPFTIPDGHTYLKTLEILVRRMKQIIDEIDENNVELFDLVVEVLNSKIDEINDAFTEFEGEVDDKLASVDTKISELEVFVNDAVDSIINNSIELQDTVLAGIIADEDSDSRYVADALYKQFINLKPYIRMLLTDGETGEIISHKGDPYEITGMSLYSITKMLMGLTVFDLGVPTTEVVTVQPGDTQSSSTLIDGDELTVDALMYLIALHSDNRATQVLARHVAETRLVIPEWSNPIQTFIREMNRVAQDMGLSGGAAMTTFSRMKFSLHQTDQICRAVHDNTLTRKYFAETETTIQINGANARVADVVNTINVSADYMGYAERGVAKTGRGAYDNFTMRYRSAVDNKWYYITILGADNYTTERYSEGGKVVEANDRGITLRDYHTPVNNFSGYATVNDTDTLDITGHFDGVEKLSSVRTAFNGVFLRRRDAFVQFTIQDCIVPFNVTWGGVIPSNFRTPIPFSNALVARRNRDKHARFDITDQLGGVKGSLSDAGVWLTFSDTTVKLTFRNVSLPSGFNHYLSPEGGEYDFDRLRPIEHSYGVLMDADGPVAAFVSTDGVLQTVLRQFSGNINGSLSWELRSGDIGYVAFDTTGGVQIFGGDGVMSRENGLGTLYVSKFQTQWMVGSMAKFPDPIERIGDSTILF